MPIKFRCSHCRQFLGFSPTKAGELTDCPACGRTVRVPNLDGTVAPLPAGRIDSSDPQLAEALSALSRIGEPSTQSTTATVVVAPVAVSAPARSAPPVAAVSVQPPLPAERVAPEQSSQRAAEAIPELLFDFESSIEEPVRLPRPARRTTELRIAAALLAAVALFLAGFFTGRTFSEQITDRTPAPQTVVAAAPRHDPAVPTPAAPVPAAVPGISGAVTWQSADGQVRQDGGARVLAFPAGFPAAPPLAVAGFRAGTVPTERARAIAVIRAAGGDYAIADTAGRFTLQLAAGRYQVLFLSRHQSRDSTQPPDEGINRLLAAYFDEPAGLVGSVGAALANAEFDGTSLQLDHAFER
jgi:hypothetical protein